MAKFRINPASLKKLRANLKASMAKRQRLMALAFAAWADDTVGEIQAEIERSAFDQGILSAATTRTPVALVGTKIKTTVFNPLEYATVVEFGRRPGRGVPPPLLPLVGWAGRKGIVTHLPRNISFGGEWGKAWAASAAILRNMKRGGGGKKRSGKPMDPIVLDMLKIRLIAKKIFEKGTVGKHPFAKAWDRRTRVMRQEIASAVRR